MSEEAVNRLEAIIKRRLRIAASNQKGHFSSTWMFWGNASDYYFGPRSAVSELKVSLHKNGSGYIAFDKNYHAALQGRSIDLRRTSVEWKLPRANGGAVRVASILLPAKFFSHSELGGKQKIVNLQVSNDQLAAEISIYYSAGDGEFEMQLARSGRPMFQTHLDDGRVFYVVARETIYDPAIIPSGALKYGRQTLLDPNALTGPAADYEHLNALLWNKPPDGGALMLIDVGGVKIHRA